MPSSARPPLLHLDIPKVREYLITERIASLRRPPPDALGGRGGNWQDMIADSAEVNLVIALIFFSAVFIAYVAYDMKFRWCAA